jgi:GxxExxY protein
MSRWGNLSPVREEKDPLSEKVIGLAIQVHRALGPGLFESAYSECLACEFSFAGLKFAREVPVALTYRTVNIPCAYRLDFLIEDRLILEIKAVERFEPVHQAQLLTYLRLTGKTVGILLNFNQARLIDGILRRVIDYQNPSALSASSVISA